jgi:hypothetical protein
MPAVHSSSVAPPTPAPASVLPLYREYKLTQLTLFEDVDEVAQEDDAKALARWGALSPKARSRAPRPQPQCRARFGMRLFGRDCEGKTAAILVREFKPFFYARVPDSWDTTRMRRFLEKLREKVRSDLRASILGVDPQRSHALCGFDAGALHSFVKITFSNLRAFNEVKKFWYEEPQRQPAAGGGDGDRNSGDRRDCALLARGFEGTFLYEANVPPVLRFLHINDVSPSGWIRLNPGTFRYVREGPLRTCHADYEYVVKHKDVISVGDCDAAVPYVSASFDIEAEGLHGDFPVPVKTYSKLAGELLEVYGRAGASGGATLSLLRRAVMYAFGLGQDGDADADEREFGGIVHRVFPKRAVTVEDLDARIDAWLTSVVTDKVFKGGAGSGSKDAALAKKMMMLEAQFAAMQTRCATKPTTTSSSDGGAENADAALKHVSTNLVGAHDPYERTEHCNHGGCQRPTERSEQAVCWVGLPR